MLRRSCRQHPLFRTNKNSRRHVCRRASAMGLRSNSALARHLENGDVPRFVTVERGAGGGVTVSDLQILRTSARLCLCHRSRCRCLTRVELKHLPHNPRPPRPVFGSNRNLKSRKLSTLSISPAAVPPRAVWGLEDLAEHRA